MLSRLATTLLLACACSSAWAQDDGLPLGTAPGSSRVAANCPPGTLERAQAWRQALAQAGLRPRSVQAAFFRSTQTLELEAEVPGATLRRIWHHDSARAIDHASRSTEAAFARVAQGAEAPEQSPESYSMWEVRMDESVEVVRHASPPGRSLDGVERHLIEACWGGPEAPPDYLALFSAAEWGGRFRASVEASRSAHNNPLSWLIAGSLNRLYGGEERLIDPPGGRSVDPYHVEWERYEDDDKRVRVVMPGGDLRLVKTSDVQRVEFEPIDGDSCCHLHLDANGEPVEPAAPAQSGGGLIDVLRKR